MSRATINIISVDEDLRSAIRKINDNFRALNKDIHLTEINSGGGESITKHNELSGRDDPLCHPMSAIEGLASRISLIDTQLGDLEITVGDHEKRIEELERQ